MAQRHLCSLLCLLGSVIAGLWCGGWNRGTLTKAAPNTNPGGILTCDRGTRLDTRTKNDQHDANNTATTGHNTT